MNITRKQPSGPADPRARLDALISKGYSSLTLEERSEAEKLVEDDVEQWRRHIVEMILHDVETRRFTKREISRLTGYHEARVSSMTGGNQRPSERFIAALSLTVPGYQHVYAEFRRRADRLYLPGGLSRDQIEEKNARLQLISDALRAQIPGLRRAVERLQEIAGDKAGSEDGE